MASKKAILSFLIIPILLSLLFMDHAEAKKKHRKHSHNLFSSGSQLNETKLDDEGNTSALNGTDNLALVKYSKPSLPPPSIPEKVPLAIEAPPMSGKNPLAIEAPPTPEEKPLAIGAPLKPENQSLASEDLPASMLQSMGSQDTSKPVEQPAQEPLTTAGLLSESGQQPLDIGALPGLMIPSFPAFPPLGQMGPPPPPPFWQPEEQAHTGKPLGFLENLFNFANKEELLPTAEKLFNDINVLPPSSDLRFHPHKPVTIRGGIAEIEVSFSPNILFSLLGIKKCNKTGSFTQGTQTTMAPSPSSPPMATALPEYPGMPTPNTTSMSSTTTAAPTSLDEPSMTTESEGQERHDNIPVNMTESAMPLSSPQCLNMSNPDAPASTVSTAPATMAGTPEPTMLAPDPTMQTPEPTMQAPESTMQTPEPTTQTPEPTMQAPEPTMQAPEPTMQAPEPTMQTPGPAQEVTPMPVQPTQQEDQPPLAQPLNPGLPIMMPVPATMGTPAEPMDPVQFCKGKATGDYVDETSSDCRAYYVCHSEPYIREGVRYSRHLCSPGMVFHKTRRMCVEASIYRCPGKTETMPTAPMMPAAPAPMVGGPLQQTRPGPTSKTTPMAQKPTLQQDQPTPVQPLNPGHPVLMLGPPTLVNSTVTNTTMVTPAQPMDPAMFCKGKITGLYADESSDCKAFYVCGFHNIRLPCSHQKVFDQKMGHCVKLENGGGCPGKNKTTTPATPLRRIPQKAEEFCQGKPNGSYPDESSDCQYYYYCFTSHRKSYFSRIGCSLEQIFDKYKDRCVDRDAKNMGHCPK